MVAKAMANQDRANAEQQAMINRLADEFSNELNSLAFAYLVWKVPWVM